MTSMPCWEDAGDLPGGGVFHDPTHGRIDRDIQQAVEEMRPKNLGQRVALENTMQNRRNVGMVVLGQPPIPDHIYKVWGDMAVLCRDHKAGPTWHHREYHAPRSVRESPADISRQRREVVEYVDALASYADRHAPQMTAFDLAVMTAIVFRPGTGFWSRARNAWKVLIG